MAEAGPASVLDRREQPAVDDLENGPTGHGGVIARSGRTERASPVRAAPAGLAARPRR
jgi:hypothetical protein